MWGKNCIGFLKGLVGINLLHKRHFEIVIVSHAFGRRIQGAGTKVNSKKRTGPEETCAVQ